MLRKSASPHLHHMFNLVFGIGCGTFLFEHLEKRERKQQFGVVIMKSNHIMCLYDLTCCHGIYAVRVCFMPSPEKPE